jgi:hypothetical protein
LDCGASRKAKGILRTKSDIMKSKHKYSRIILKKVPFVYRLITLVLRYFRSYTFDKSAFKIKSGSKAEVFKRIYKSNFWESKESKSGGGSTIASTTAIRSQLPLVIKKYNISSILDIPCGDYNWMKEVDLPVFYTGADIVDELISENNERFAKDKVGFVKLDITKDNLPKVDLIFCKDLFQHLSYEDVFSAIDSIKKSKSKYLLTTSYDLTIRNYDIISGDYRALNLMKKPFCFNEPLLEISENFSFEMINVEPDKTMYLFEIAKLP